MINKQCRIILRVLYGLPFIKEIQHLYIPTLTQKVKFMTLYSGHVRPTVRPLKMTNGMMQFLENRQSLSYFTLQRS